jgi:hypothetical protein
VRKDSPSEAAASRKTRPPPLPSSLQTTTSSSKITPRTTTGGDLLVETWYGLLLAGMLYVRWCLCISTDLGADEEGKLKYVVVNTTTDRSRRAIYRERESREELYIERRAIYREELHRKLTLRTS